MYAELKKIKNIKKQRTGTKVIIPGRLTYAHLDEPWSSNPGDNKKYSTGILIPKDDTETVTAIREAIEAARQEGKATKWNGRLPAKINQPLRDGDEERPDDEAYAGCYFINANSSRPVAVLNRLKQRLEGSEAYSGCFALVSVNFFPYDTNGNRGVGAGLSAVMKYADGEPLGGGDGSRDFDGMDLDMDDDDIDDL